MEYEPFYGGEVSYGGSGVPDLTAVSRQNLPIDYCILDEEFAATMNSTPSTGQKATLTDFGGGEIEVKSSVTFKEEPKFVEETADADSYMNELARHRVKWTDNMVRLLITVVSYAVEDASLGRTARRKVTSSPANGKWGLISRVMAAKGHRVSPQQCEDKFNDLNKRYKKLNSMIGHGIACQVVENPSLLHLLDHISEKEKEEVRRILSSKQLFYEEMCSYNNKNRNFLPPDPSVQRLVHLALRNKPDVSGSAQPRDDERGHMTLNPHPCLALRSESRASLIGEKRSWIVLKLKELDAERLRCEASSKRMDLKLEKMRMANEKLRIQNEILALELKHKERFLAP